MKIYEYEDVVASPRELTIHSETITSTFSGKSMFSTLPLTTLRRQHLSVLYQSTFDEKASRDYVAQPVGLDVALSFEGHSAGIDSVHFSGASLCREHG